jgi:membrane protease YdiL (CAAX protease family)
MRSRWIILWIIVGAPLMSLTAYLVGFVLISFGTLSEYSDPLIESLAFGLATQGVLLLWGIWVIRRKSLSRSAIIGRIPQNYPWLVALGIIIAMLLYSVGASWVFSYPLTLFAPDALIDLLNTRMFLDATETASPILTNSWTFLLIVILAPISEELVFRGLLLSRWSTKWGHTKAILLSSTIFGSLHFPDIIGAFMFGLVMCTLYIKTRTLVIPVIVHVGNNLTACMLSLLLPASTVDVNSLQNVQDDLYLGLCFVLFTSPWLVILITRWWPAKNDRIPYLRNFEETHE